MLVLLPLLKTALVHVTELQNTMTTVTRNPTFRVGWTVASLGSTTNLSINGGVASAMLEGIAESVRDPFSARIQTFGATTTETVAIAFRVRGDFNGTTNQREVLHQVIFVGVDETSTCLKSTSRY